MDRCTGHCCRKFYLPYDPDQLKQWAIEQTGTLNEKDSKIISEMVIPLYPAITGAPFLEKIGGQVMKDGYFYTCKHLNIETGDCRNYKNRPKMCSDYPYGQECQYIDCTWDDAKLVKLKVNT